MSSGYTWLRKVIISGILEVYENDILIAAIASRIEIVRYLQKCKELQNMNASRSRCRTAGKIEKKSTFGFPGIGENVEIRSFH